MDSDDTNHVVASVIRYNERYLIWQRDYEDDNTWEFIGGKVKEDESYRRAFVREFEEETRENRNERGIELEEDYVVEIADPSPSKDNPDFSLVPVLAEIPEEKYREINHLDTEEIPDHQNKEWVTVNEFDEYETKGQRQCLEAFDLI